MADYNQIELRCIAHLAEDPGLIESFTAGRDIHTETASRIFGVEPGDVTIDQRSKAKMVSYGLAYGMEAYGLGQRLNIATEDAAVILDAYFEAFPSVREYMDRTVAEARERGYTETLFGRRRQIPELSSPNFRIRQAGERQAMNAGIQGLAADIFKVALVRIETALEDAGMDSRLILQVHDEVLLDVPPSEHDSAAKLVVEAMRARSSSASRWRSTCRSARPGPTPRADAVRPRARGQRLGNRHVARAHLEGATNSQAVGEHGRQHRGDVVARGPCRHGRGAPPAVTRPVPGSSVSETGRTIVHARSLARSASSASALACRYAAHRSLALLGPVRPDRRHDQVAVRRRRPGRRR